jgi:hypothetical protein
MKLLEYSVEGAAAYNSIAQKIHDSGAFTYETLYQSDLIGWAGLLLVLVSVTFFSARHPRLMFVLGIAFLIRAVAALFHFYVMPLPDGTGDANKFDLWAFAYSAGGWQDVLNWYPGARSHFYPWLMSLVYLITGRSFLLLQSISVFFGVLSVYATWLLGSEVWGERAGRRAAWVMALFPTVVMYSALPLREAYLVCLLMFGLVWVARWSRDGKIRQAIWAFLLFGVGIFFHSSIFLIALAFLMVIAGKIFWRGGQSFIRGRLHLTALAGMFVVVGGITVWALSGVYVDKLGRSTDIFDLERWVSYSQAKYYADGHAANAVYPGWTAPETVGDLVWAVPVKITYLLFAPFPWDIKTPAHLIGLIDGLLYLGLIIIITRNIKTIWRNPAARTILLVILPFILAYGIGTSNFGTSIRHRAKFAGALIILASFWFARLVIHRTPTNSGHNLVQPNQNISIGAPTNRNIP